MGALRDVIRRFDTLDVQKHPQRLPFPHQPSGKRPGFVLSASVLVHQRAEARIPGPPLSNRWPCRAHMTQPLELSVYSYTKASHACLHTLCQPFGRAHQMRQATLSESLPVPIDEVPIADEDAIPIPNELRKCSFGAVGVYLEVGDVRIRYHPHPAPVTLLDRPLAQRYPKHGSTQVLHRTAARSDDACHFTYEACQPRAIATALVGRDGGFAEFAA